MPARMIRRDAIAQAVLVDLLAKPHQEDTAGGEAAKIPISQKRARGR